ncbi:MAG: twin-arginine translocase TatA/TatE family subunit [Ignavibacteria bacterium]|nr:twin-arginine translocase TatA/TatE family subunit [Bacteroidota bacterium]MSQ46361.1 twin-arginine translocase TatA/TatE family subunit [Ignavibacteria bacterium]
MPNLGTWEIVLIVALVLVLFGAKKIPDFAQGLGKGIKEFKRALKGDDADSSDDKKNDSQGKTK